MQKNNDNTAVRLCGMLGLASRARNLCCGTQLVCDCVRRGSVKLVLVASDASENTKKRVFNCCRYYECECSEIPVSTFALGDAVGKRGALGAVALVDKNMANGVRKLLYAALANGTEADESPREV